MKVMRLEAHDLLGVQSVSMWWPILIARLWLPALVAAIRRPWMLRSIAAASLMRKRHVANAVEQISVVYDPVADHMDDLAFARQTRAGSRARPCR